METSSQALTVADLPDGPIWPLHELVDGGLHVFPASDAEHQLAVSRLFRHLAIALEPGHEIYSPLNVLAGPDTLVIPDLVVTRHVLGKVLGATPEECVLLVEVLSPSTRRHDLNTKRALYREWGVSAWFVDAPTGVVVADGDAYRTAPLPGFTLSST